MCVEVLLWCVVVVWCWLCVALFWFELCCLLMLVMCLHCVVMLCSDMSGIFWFCVYRVVVQLCGVVC